MSVWTRAELDAGASAAELTISTRRADGTLRPPVPVWVVRAGDEIFIGSRKARCLPRPQPEQGGSTCISNPRTQP